MFVTPGWLRGVAVVLAVGAAAPAAAQDTRQEALAAERAEKASQLKPYEPSPLERRIQSLENLLGGERRFYSFIGGAYEGGAIAFGPGFRTRFAETGMFNAHAAWSLKNYKVAAASMKLPSLANGRIEVKLDGEWLDAPSVPTYGVGNDTQREAKTTFAYRSTTAGVSTRIQPVRFVAVGGGIDAMSISSPDADPDYRRTRAFAEFDWRSSPGYTRSGGLYRVDWSDYRANGGGHDFQRVDAEVKQFVPLLRENWVIAMRALVSSTSTSAGDAVPHVLLPALGGGNTLRGYSSWRFRDRNRLLLTGEYRWTAGPFLDMALFMDAGKVAPRFSDLNLQDLKTSYGIGMTIHTFTRTITRMELARTSEGMGVAFSFGANF
jgi:hypothetical protein